MLTFVIVRVDVVHVRQDLVHVRAGVVHVRVDVVHVRVDVVHVREDLVQGRVDVVQGRVEPIVLAMVCLNFYICHLHPGSLLAPQCSDMCTKYHSNEPPGSAVSTLSASRCHTHTSL